MANRPPITNQIAKVQTAKKLIAFVDKLNPAPLSNFAQIHAQGEQVNGRKVYSLIGIEIQDYSNGTGEKNVRVKFNLSPQYLQFLLTRVEQGWTEYTDSQTKIYGNPGPDGLCPAQSLQITRRQTDSKGSLLRRPWMIAIDNGRGARAGNEHGGGYLQSGSYISFASAGISLTDQELFIVLKQVDTYIKTWEFSVGPALVAQGRDAYRNWLNSFQAPDSNVYPGE